MSSLEPIEGLWPIRLRPAMYIGAATPEHLVETVVKNITIGTPRPRIVRVHPFAGNALTIAIDSDPLSIEPVGDVAHPALYSLFLRITDHARPLGHGGCIVNALSARLVVSTMHDGVRYRAAFSRGGLVTLLSPVPCDEPLGASWLTFEPDTTILTGELTFEGLREIVSRLTGDVAVAAIDSREQRAEWW